MFIIDHLCFLRVSVGSPAFLHELLNMCFNSVAVAINMKIDMNEYGYE